MPPGQLSQVLRKLKKENKDGDNIIVGLDDISDDAAVYKLNDFYGIILTVDFITPVVDDPYYYGAIAAANSLSDVYAMGGDVLLALNICGFPSNLPQDVIFKILQGGQEKIIEAGGILAGGHTIDDNEPKYGLVVMGIVHPDKILTKGGAKPGDKLVLTKPLGSGIITTSAKGGVAKEEDLERAIESMARLNKKSSQIIQKIGVNACTDITGFALIGHSLEMCLKSNVSFNFYIDKIPFLEGSKKYADMWLFPCGTNNNKSAYEKFVHFEKISEEIKYLLYTPETSGGLLISVPSEKINILSEKFQKEKEPFWIIGEVVGKKEGDLEKRISFK